VHARLAGDQALLGGATQLAQGGIAVRVLGHMHATVQQALYDIWDMLRRELLGYPAVVWRT
jgi:urease accessory protein UreH